MAKNHTSGKTAENISYDVGKLKVRHLFTRIPRDHSREANFCRAEWGKPG
jgi:hypothetical protein